MTQSRKFFWMDVVNFTLFLSLGVTGLIMRYILPPGSARPRGGGQGFHGGRPVLTLWGMDRHDWGDIHFWLAVALAVAVLIHLIQHWQWIARQFRSNA